MTKDCEAGAPCVFSDEDLQASAASRVSAVDQQKRPVDSEQEMVPGGMVAPSDVIVHGPGGIEAVLKTLRDIAETRESAGNSSHPPEAPAASRQYKDVNEFKALQQRAKSRDATVRLRKVFVCQGECNVMQEIWIEDKKNPAAQGNPLKSYAIVHAHHHALAGDKEGITVEDLDVVDAINVRHLAPAGKGCQKDNPFFNTFIEPSGPSTLKVFPPEKEWTCDVCGQKNAQASAFCRPLDWQCPKCKAQVWGNKMDCFRCKFRNEKGGRPCGGKRPCRKWNWRREQHRDKGLADILASADAALQWTSGSAKSMHRAAGAASEGSLGSGPFLLEDVMKQYTRQPRKDLRKQMVHPEAGPQPCDACNCSPCSDGCEAWHGLRAAVLCIGFDEYKHLSNLRNAKRDAYEIQRRVNALPRCRAEVIAEQCASNGQELRKDFSRGLE